MISRFSGQYSFLSNFFPSFVNLDSYIYPSVENAYQAAKTTDFTLRNEFLDIPPNEAKRRGRKLTLRPDWEEKKLNIMECLLRQKFHNKYLRSLLVETGDEELVEGNYWGDKFWGVCNGEGENHLGRLLMKIREEYKPCPECLSVGFHKMSCDTGQKH